jgi:hypothetical protein
VEKPGALGIALDSLFDRVAHLEVTAAELLLGVAVEGGGSGLEGWAGLGWQCVG